MPVRSGRGSVASTSIRSASRANSASASVGRQSAPYTIRPEPFVELMLIANVSVKWGTGWKVTRIGPISISLAGSYSRRLERVLDQVLVPPGADHAPEHFRAPGGAWSTGHAGQSVPGQRSTGTGCWRGA